MKRILNLKDWLLENDLVEDNDYLTNYLDLLSLNLETAAVKSITQAHHAIPVAYYKKMFKKEIAGRNRSYYDSLANADPNNFKLNLKYTDHLLAHCYLALCAKPDWFKFANANMITVVSKYTNLEDFAKLENLEAYQEAYTLSCELKRGKTLTEEHKAKISASHNRSEEYSRKISEANSRRIWTPESRAKLSNSLKNSEKLIQSRFGRPSSSKGKVWVSNGETSKIVSKEEISNYLNLGYWVGKNTSLQIRKDGQEIIIHPKDWPTYEAAGWKKYWKSRKKK